jgi:hypothetical protein
VILTAAVCPHPPLLLRELCGTQDPVASLREACREAVGALLAGRPDTVAVVGGAGEARAWDPTLPVGVRRFGTTAAPDAVGLPQSLGVGSRLLAEAGWDGPVHLRSVTWDAGPDVVREVARAAVIAGERATLLVLGDSSARRGEKAPGHLDERAFGFDEEVGRALEQGDPATLAGLDPALAEELMAHGRAAYAVLGEVALRQHGAPRGRLLYRDDPHGVMYTVALWDLS